MSATAEDRLRHRAARLLCRARAPGLFLASHLLPLARRQALYSVAAVIGQLYDVLAGGANPAGESGGESGGGPGGDSGMSTSPASSGGDSGGGGCATCGAGGRLSICAAMLDHLFAGKPTGKPELDVFAGVCTAMGLERFWFDDLCAGLEQELTVRRCATWLRRSQLLELTGGSGARIVASLLGLPRAELEQPTLSRQVVAWGSALRMTRLLLDWRRQSSRGVLVIPLDDLVQQGVTESEVARWTAGQTGERCAAVVRGQTQRLRKMLAGGGRWVQALHDRRSARAATVYEALHRGALSRMEANPGQLFTGMAFPRWSDKLRALTAVSRLQGVG